MHKLAHAQVKTFQLQLFIKPQPHKKSFIGVQLSKSNNRHKENYT